MKPNYQFFKKILFQCLIYLCFFFRPTIASSCLSTHYDATIEDLCQTCSYYDQSDFTTYTCEECASGYTLFQELDSSTPQKCIAVQQLDPTHIAPKHLYKASSTLYKECGQGCTSCDEISGFDDYGCSDLKDDSRMLIQHPTIADSYYKYTTYDCRAAYYNDGAGNYQGYYNDTAKCKKCSSTCFSCENDNYCTECVYSKKRFTSQSTYYSDLSSETFDCSAMADRTDTATLNYYLRPQGTACTSTPCSNTMSDYSTYYDSFYDIMKDLIDNQSIQEKLSITVNIYIFKDENGDIGKIYLTHGFTDSAQSLLYGRLFERVLATVNIQAAQDCQTNFGHDDNTYCYQIADNERPILILKSAYIFFFVTQSFSFKYIEFHGADLMKAFDATIRSQYSSYCDPTLSGTVSTADCIPNSKSWFYMDPIDPKSGTTPEYYKMRTKKDLPVGLFVLQYIRDVSSPVIPELTIDGCIFYNFYQHKNAYSFIYFEEAGSIKITDSEFYNMFFVHGLISNTPPRNFEVLKTVASDSYYRLRYNIDRGNPYTSKNKGLSCKSSFFGLQNVISSDCHSIQISYCYFENFNPYQYRRVPLNTYQSITVGVDEENIYNTYDMTQNYDSSASTADGSLVNYNIFQEALFLGVTNINGKILLDNNEFQYALSSVNHRFDLEHNCAPFQFTHGYDATSSQENIDIVATSNYKFYIDKHMRQHLEAEERVISSLIYIRELHNEFIMYNNTFDSIIAETGAVLFVEDFSTSTSYPIMLASNKFSNNMAYAFGSNIVFKKNSNDLASVDCVGMIFYSNSFTNNIGCSNTYGNVIISCEPNHPAACPTKTSAFSSTFYDVLGVTQTTWADSFSSYYSYYNFKVNNLLAARTQNSNEQVLETAYETFLLGKTQMFTETGKYNYEDTLYTSQTFPLNLLVFSNNSFSSNYQLISNCIYIQGSMGILMKYNSFKENGVPLEDFFDFPVFQQSGFSVLTGNTLQTGLIENTYLTIMQESSPVLIRMGNYVHMYECLFYKNFAIFLGDFYFGAAITFDKMLGAKNIIIEACQFTNYYGYDRFFIKPTASYYYDYCSFPLVSVNYWINTQSYSLLNGYTVNRQIDLHTILFTSCTFSTNYFHLTPYKPSTDPANPQNSTKSNLFAKIRFVKSSPSASFTYSLIDDTKVSITNIMTDSSKYTSLISQQPQPYKYASIFHVFLEQDTGASSSTLAFNLDDTNLRPIFKSILQNFSECIFTNNQNYAGLPLFYTFSFNFSFDSNTYSSNEINETPTLFQLDPESTDVAHFVHMLGSSFSCKNSIIYIKNSNFDSNKGLLMTISDSYCLAFVSSLTIESHYINKSSIFYLQDLDGIQFHSVQLTNSITKTGIFYLDAVTNSNFSNIELFQSETELAACFYGYQATNSIFSNISCYNMEAVSDYYFSINIDIPLLTQTQPTSSLILYGCSNLSFINLYFNEMNLPNNGIMLLSSLIYVTNFTITHISSEKSWPIAMYISSSSQAYITQGLFYNITCKICQGTLFICKNILNISLCTFNESTSDKGLIYVEDSKVNITSCKFSNNTAYTQDSTINGKGGTIYIISTFFQNNQCEQQNTLSFLASIVYIISSIFESNLAGSQTKGIYFSECQNVIISKSSFKDYQVNNGDIAAGFIYSIESTLQIYESFFDGSVANYGAIYIKGDSSTFTLSNSSVFNNVAKLDAPALFIVCTSYIFWSNFYNNSVESDSYNAGHVYAESIDLIIVKGGNFSNFYENAFYLSDVSDAQVIDSFFFGDQDLLENRGIYFIDCLQILINGSIFKELVTQEYGGGIYITATVSSTIELTIENTNFTSNYAQYGGGLAIDLLTENTLLHNMTNVIFFDNFAENDGGGFYYNSQNVSSIFNITFSTISGNRATLAGGGFRFMGMLVKYDNTSKIYNNSAYYGPNIAAYPLYLKQRTLKSPDEYTWYISYSQNLSSSSSSSSSTSRLLSTSGSSSTSYRLLSTTNTTNITTDTTTNSSNNISNNSNFTNNSANNVSNNTIEENITNPEINLPSSLSSVITNDIVPGQIQIPPMIFDLYDYYGQIVRTFNTSTLTISVIDPTNTAKFSSTNQYSPINGSYILYPFDLFAPMETTISLNLSTDAFTNISGITYPGDFSFKSDYIYQSKVRSCVRNEYETDSKECWQCKTGYYNWGYSVCQACNPFTTNCYGGDYVGPQPGFWRLNGESLNVLACKTSSSCLGSNITAMNSDYYCKENLWVDPYFCVNGWCGKGYQGIYCYDCVDGWAHSGDSCVPCTNNTNYYVITVFIFIAAIIYIVFTIKKAMTVKKDEKQKSNKAAILMKILTNYFQLVSIVSSFNFNWSDNASTMVQGQSQASEATGQVFNFDCVLKSLGTQNIGLSSFFLKLSFIALFPVLAYLICRIVWLIIYLKRHKKRIKEFFSEMNNKLTTSIVVIMFIIHPNIVKTSIYGFRCANLGNTFSPVYYLEMDYEMQCWESSHLKWVFIVALPSLVVWGFGIPMMAFFHIRKNLEKLQDLEFKKAYGFLYDGYKIDRYFWEFVILYRKIIMIFISVFLVTYSLATQALAVLAVSFASYIIHIKSQPFIDNDLNEAEKRSLVVSSFTIYCGLYYISGGLSTGVDILLLILMVFVNAHFIYVWLKAYLSEQILQLKQAGTWDKIMSKIQKKKKSSNVVVPITSDKENEEKDEKINEEEKSLKKSPTKSNNNSSFSEKEQVNKNDDRSSGGQEENNNLIESKAQSYVEDQEQNNIKNNPLEDKE